MVTNAVLLGAIAMASLVAALVFLRFWRSSHDRFFLFFAASFGIEGVNRAVFALAHERTENEPVYYLVRLLAYALIIVAIVDKNRARR